MRTTVEITEEQHRALTALAAERRLRGFSQLVQDALDRYLAHERSRDLAAVLALEGSLDDDEADRLRRSVDDAWATWPAR